MARKKPSAGIGTNPVPFGMSLKQMKRKKPINLDLIKKIEPLTDNQQLFFDSYKGNKNLIAYGCAGTGKTFITLYNALMDVLDPKSPYEKIYIVRSLVATREIGFLPGDHDDKSYLYQIPYKHMVKYMFQMPDDASFDMLYGKGICRTGELIDMGIQCGVLNQSGSWISMAVPDEEGGSLDPLPPFAQGREKAKDVLDNNAELYNEIDSKIKLALKKVQDMKHSSPSNNHDNCLLYTSPSPRD